MLRNRDLTVQKCTRHSGLEEFAKHMCCEYLLNSCAAYIVGVRCFRPVGSFENLANFFFYCDRVELHVHICLHHDEGLHSLAPSSVVHALGCQLVAERIRALAAAHRSI